MHIPDNYLSPSTCAVLGAAMVPVWAVAIKKVKEEVPSEKLPLLGIGAAFSFLIMMFNVPLPGGTTGHAVGGALLSVLLGPWAACISVTVALLLQAVLFGDGGILALGANCFNMAFVLPFLSYFLYRFIKDRVKGGAGDSIGLAVAAYAGLNIAALCAAIEFGLQPLLFKNAAGLPLYCPYPLSIAVPAMTLPHLAVAGFVEAVFTLGIIAFIRRVSPGMIREEGKARIKAVYGLLVALVCLTPIGLLAAGTAWGEWGVDEISKVEAGGKALGFIPEGMEKGFSFSALFPDYAIEGMPEAAGYVLSAVAGTALLVIAFKLLGLVIRGGRGKARA